MLLGLGSTGVHSNGYSLVRKVVEKSGLAWGDDAPFAKDRSLAQALMEPTRIYVKPVLPLMKARGWGRIVNFSGIAPFLGHGAPKAMAKVAIVGFTRGLATEFAPFGITANCVGPGTIQVERDAFQGDKTVRPEQPVRRARLFLGATAGLGLGLADLAQAKGQFFAHGGKQNLMIGVLKQDAKRGQHAAPVF